MEDWLAERTQTSPKKTALIIGYRRWSYGELNELVNGMVAILSQNGIQPGDIVAAMLSNSLEYVCLVHGLARLGAILMPLNTRLTEQEIEWQLTHTSCGRLFYDQNNAEKAKKLASNGRLLVQIEDLAEKTELHLAPKTPFSLENLQAIVFTSGTTGRPKGAMLTFANHFWSAAASAFRLGTQCDDRWLSCLPLYHVGGLAVIFRSCLYGTAVVLHDGFDLDEINSSLDTQEITLISLVPTMLYRLLDSRPEGEWPSSLRLILLGGAAATPELLNSCRQLALPVATTYGLTEASSQVATMLPDDVMRKPGSVGKPLLFTSVRIAGENGETIPPGQYGEIVVSGPAVMTGYYQNPKATTETIQEGELFTGDIGYLDEEGDLWLVQRRRDIIISGGENVYPAEVEAYLHQHPAVAAVCVVGIDNPEWGQQVAAMIVLREKESISDMELIHSCRQGLAGYKIPRLIKFVSHLPQTSSGKIHRRAVEDAMNLSVVTSEI